MNKDENTLKSKELKKDMLFVLKQLHERNKLTESEYYRAVDSVQRNY